MIFESVNPVNLLLQVTGSCFTDYIIVVAQHPKEVERSGRLCILAVHFTLLSNFVYQSVPQGAL